MESDQGVYRCLAVSTQNRRNNSGQTILNVNCKFTSKALIVFRHIMNDLGLSRLGFEHPTFSMQGDRCLESSWEFLLHLEWSPVIAGDGMRKLQCSTKNAWSSVAFLSRGDLPWTGWLIRRIFREDKSPACILLKGLDYIFEIIKSMIYLILSHVS